MATSFCVWRNGRAHGCKAHFAEDWKTHPRCRIFSAALSWVYGTKHRKTLRNRFSKPAHFIFLLSRVCTLASSPRCYGCLQQSRGFRANCRPPLSYRCSSFTRQLPVSTFPAYWPRLLARSSLADYFSNAGFSFLTVSQRRHSFSFRGIRTNCFRQVFNSPLLLSLPSFYLPIRSPDCCSAGLLPIPSYHEACCAVRNAGCIQAPNGSAAAPASHSQHGSVRYRWYSGIFTSLRRSRWSRI